MTHTFTSIRAVLSSLASTFPTDVWNEADALEWAAFALQSIGVYTQLEPHIVFLTVANHRAKLPKGLVTLEQAAYKARRTLTEEDLASIQAEIQIPTESYYTGFLTLANRYNYRPMRKATGTFALQQACEECDEMYPVGNPEYVLLPNGCIHTSFATGDICVSYMRYPMDENGEFLIPDNPTFIRAITYYISMKIWERRMNMKEEGAYNMFNMYLDLWSALSTRVAGELMMPDIDTRQNIKDMTDRFFPSTNKYYSFFGNLNSPEQPYLGGRWSKAGTLR